MNKKLTLGVILLLLLIILIPILTPILKNIFNNKIIEGASTANQKICDKPKLSIQEAYTCLLLRFKGEINKVTKDLKRILGDNYHNVITETSFPIDGTRLTIPTVKKHILNPTGSFSPDLIKAFTTPIEKKDAYDGVSLIIPTMFTQSIISNLENLHLIPRIVTIKKT